MAPRTAQSHCRFTIEDCIHSDALPGAVIAVLPRVVQVSPAGAIMANRPRESNGRAGLGWASLVLHLAGPLFSFHTYLPVLSM